jgi:hypothetical protein
MRPGHEVNAVHALAYQGRNPCEISRLTGIPRSTVRDWLGERRPPKKRPADQCEVCGHAAHRFDCLPEPEYAYLLGLYLGDGTISRGPRRCFRLRIFMDMRYRAVIAECAGAMVVVMPTSKVAVLNRSGGGAAAQISSYSNAWPCLIPQCGPGPKHKRKIALEPWQEAIVARHPDRFVRGLIHSDGCRVLNRVNGKDYPRYFFSQVSTDIQGLFCRACDRLGVEYAYNNPHSISVARRTSVATLDRIVGPKT